MRMRRPSWRFRASPSTRSGTKSPSQLASTGSWRRRSRASVPLAGRSRCTQASSISHVTSPRAVRTPSARTSSSTRGAVTLRPSGSSSIWRDRPRGTRHSMGGPPSSPRARVTRRRSTASGGWRCSTGRAPRSQVEPFGIAPGTGLDGLEGIPAGTKFAFYGGWLYRRYTPYDLTPPGLPRPIYTDLKLSEDDESRLRLTRRPH